MILKNKMKNLINKEKIKVKVLISEDEKDFCAKCCKTIQVIKRMMEAIPEFEDNLIVTYKDINSKEITEEFGKLQSPVVLINNDIYSQGHVPIIKKLCYTLLQLVK